MLKGKIAVVTGGTRGIGYAIVKKYLENGAKVILFGSRQETVDKALASLKEENPEWEVSGACPSLTDAKEVADEIQAIHRKYGKIDILVNNAGVSDSMMTIDCNPEHFQEIINLNVNAVQYHRPLRSLPSCSGWERVLPLSASPPKRLVISVRAGLARSNPLCVSSLVQSLIYIFGITSAFVSKLTRICASKSVHSLIDN